MSEFSRSVESSDNNFDLIRLLSACAVILGHSFALSLNKSGFEDPVENIIHFAYSGGVAVDIFFIISGIFVTKSFYNDPNLYRFSVKRFFRIWPGLIFCLFCSVVIFGSIVVKITDRKYFIHSDLPYDYIIRNSFLVWRWGIDGLLDGRKYTAVNGSLWSLLVEVKLYCLVSVIGIFGFMSRSYILAGCASALIITLAINSVLFSIISTDHDSIVPIYFFLFGILIFSVRENINISLKSIVTVALIFLVADGPLREAAFYGLLAITVIKAGCIPVSVTRWRLKHDYSYGMYLYGFPIEQIVVTLWPDANPYQLFIVTLPIAGFFAFVSWHAVEQPGLVFSRKLLRRGMWRNSQPNSSLIEGPQTLNWAGAAQIVIPCAILFLAFGGECIALVHPPTPRSLGLSITAFGPTPLARGQPFNIQPDGSSALWLRLDRKVTTDVSIVFSGEALPTVVEGDVVTAAVPVGLVREAGSKEIWVEAETSDGIKRSNVVAIDVQ